MSDTFTFLVGGKAGEGVKKAGTVAASFFSGMGRSVFQLDDYQSLIRGGHNFCVVSSSADTVTSHYEKADLVVVGGGVIGTSIAYHLAREKVKVTLVEQKTVGSGTSFASSVGAGGGVPDHYVNLPEMGRLVWTEIPDSKEDHPGYR